MDININIPDGWGVPEDEYTSMEEVPMLDPEEEKKEEWKRWKDSPYQVSNMGRVRRVQENGEFKLRKPRSDDRGKFRMNATWVRNGTPYREEFFIHQAVMALYGPEKPSGEHIVVCHRKPTGEDGKPDNRISNLYWCDRSRNVKDSWDDGLMEQGAKWKD
jgi:acyl-CoA thioesterase